ncbi:MAG: sensor histidine kinase [Halobacteriaceae archaeon]
MAPALDQLAERGDFRDLFAHLDEIALWIAVGPREFAYVSPGFEDIYELPTERVESDARALFERIHPDDQEMIAELVQRSEEELRDETVEHRLLLPDGTVKWVQTRLFLIREGEESPVMVGVTTDVTEQKERERSLEVLNQVLRHDVRNHMNVMLGWLESAAAAAEGDALAAIERARASGEQVVELTDVAGDLVEVITCGAEMDLEPTRVGEVVETEVETLRRSHPEVDVSLRQPDEAVTVEANALLSSAVRNLLNNAVQHNDSDDPRVAVTVDADPETVRVRVADNGPGIPDAQKETLFTEGAAGMESAGTGMGLFLAREIAEAFGGDIDVADNEPRGTTFTIALPRAE